MVFAFDHFINRCKRTNATRKELTFKFGRGRGGCQNIIAIYTPPSLTRFKHVKYNSPVRHTDGVQILNSVTAKINTQRVLLLYTDLTFKWGGSKYYSYNILTPPSSPTHPQHKNK